MSPPNVDSPEENDTSYHQVPTSENMPRELISNNDLTHESETLGEKSDETDLLSSEISSSDAEVVVPPDGGWGWIVVLGSFMCNVVVDGIIFSFGTFLDSIGGEFKVDKAKVTLAGSLMSGFYLIAGPFVSAIANKYGFRVVTIFGAVLSAIAFALSHFATSVTYLCITYGVLGGIGFGFVYAPSIIIIGFYFERWRALATGIAVCGSGIGAFVFAPMNQFLIAQFGWRGALLCQGAMALSCALFGMTYRPLKPTKVKEIVIDEKPELNMDPTKIPPAARLKMEQAIKQMKRNSIRSLQDHEHSISKLFGANNNSEYPRVSDVYHTIGIPNRRTIGKEKTLSVPFLADHGKAKPDRKSHLIDLDKLKPLILPRRNRTSSENRDDREIVRPLYRDDIFFGASPTRLPQYTSKTSLEYNLTVTRLPTKNDIEEERQHKCKLCPEAFRRVLATMLDFSLMKSLTFLILAVGGFFTMMGFFVPYMYLVDRATESHIDANTAVWLVSATGIANTVGRVLCGSVSSIPAVNALVLNNAALTAAGVATMLSGLSVSIEYQFFYCIIFGLFISCFASLRSVVVVDLLGLEKLTNAFGLLLLFQGVAAIVGAPLAGEFKNWFGSYDACFYLSGGMLFISAVMCYPLNWVNKWERRRNGTDTETALVV